jgi:hypothetical protein
MPCEDRIHDLRLSLGHGIRGRGLVSLLVARFILNERKTSDRGVARATNPP